MKLTKILIFGLIFALMISLIGCDASSLLGSDDDDTSLDGGEGDTTGGEGDTELGGNGNNNSDEGGNNDGPTGGNGGNNDDPTGGNGGENEGEENGDEEHVCNYIFYSKTEASCTLEGEEIYKCSCGNTQKNVLEKVAHTEEIIPATDPTDTEPGKTEGKKCSVCGFVILAQEYVFSGDYGVAEKYDGDYAYNSLLALTKGEKLTTLYNSIDKLADEFHKSGADASANNDYIIGEVNFAELGLSEEEAIAVWSAYKMDRPLYYWISNNVLYSSRALNIVCDAEYADSDVRAALNAKIYTSVERYVEEAYSSSIYNTVLAFHDLIILAIDYAYEADGSTPEDAVWAHNVIGVFENGLGVCESYAKTFQLLLNYCDIENILVSGWANEAHAWNLVKLDDGEWYWCDLTWDDRPEFAMGIQYNYFCVTDSENVGWSDGPFTVNASTFISTHTPNPKVDTGVYFAYDLPARSASSFDGAEIMLRDTFDIGSLSYAIAGYNSVQLISVNANGNVDIPSTVTYKGETFTVASIGKMENGRFTVGSIAAYKVGVYTEQFTVGRVSIPDSVIFIWDDAFNMDFLESITVDQNNKKFTSLDGVLYTKDLSVLIKYPTAKAGKTYTLPTETVKIAAGAFATLYSNTNDKLQLESIYLGASGVVAGVRNYGYGYENAEYFESDPWAKIRRVLSGEAVIYDGSAAA